MIISFAYTTDALLAGKKTVTRRQWNDRYFQQWVRAWREGKHVHDAYDRSPRIGGCKVATIKLACEPYKERLADMPASDLEAEGGLWDSIEDFIGDHDPNEEWCVVRFELVERVKKQSEAGDRPKSKNGQKRM